MIISSTAQCCNNSDGNTNQTEAGLSHKLYNHNLLQITASHSSIHHFYPHLVDGLGAGHHQGGVSEGLQQTLALSILTS